MKALDRQRKPPLAHLRAETPLPSSKPPPDNERHDALTAAHLDTAALTWDMQRRIDTSALPGRLVVLEIDFTDRPASDRRFWLHLSPAGVDLCRRDTGAPVDLWLSGATEPITRWWLGQLTWPQLLRDPGVTVHGDRSLQRGMDRWFLRYAYTPQALGA